MLLGDNTACRAVVLRLIRFWWVEFAFHLDSVLDTYIVDHTVYSVPTRAQFALRRTFRNVFIA